MPITKSAKKALRQGLRRRARNIRIAENLKKVVKDIKRSLLANDMTKTISLLSVAYKAHDKAAKTGFLKKNTASRKKSSLAKLLRAKQKSV